MFTALALAGPSAVAQDATSAGQPQLFADPMGLPELRIIATDTGYEGVPTETVAGRYLVTFTNSAARQAAVDFMRLPQGVGLENLAPPPVPGPPPAELGSGPGLDATLVPGAAGGTPPPEWYYTTYMAGGAGAAPGQTVQAIVDLTPGAYAVWGETPDAPQAPAALTVTGEAGATPPSAPAEPVADVTVREIKTADGYAFQLVGELGPGPQVVRVQNLSDQPHYTLLLRSPAPITREQVLHLDQLSREEFATAAYAATQSAGTTQWLATNLEPGYYVIACFVLDPTKGFVLHASEGMIDVVVVGDPGTPVS
jgi:hypothetical protein